MRTRLNLASILGFVVLILKPSLVLTAAMSVSERPSIQEVEEYAVNVAKKINEVVESILSASTKEYSYQGVLNPWNQLLKQVSQHFYALNAIAVSDLPCNVTAYQAIEGLNTLMAEILNYPFLSQVLLECSREIMNEYESDSFQHYVAAGFIENWQEPIYRKIIF